VEIEPHIPLPIYGTQTRVCPTHAKFFRGSRFIELLAEILVDTNQGSWDSAEGRKGSGVLPRTRHSAAMDWGKELIDVFERVVHRDFPNPKRVGCPGHDSLVALGTCRTDAQAPLVLDHIRQCAPCFDELKQLRQTQGSRP